MIQFLTEFFVCAFLLYVSGVVSKGLHQFMSDFFLGRISLAYQRNFFAQFVESFGYILKPTSFPQATSSLFLFVLGPYICFFQMTFVLMFMPIGYDLMLMSDDTNILWIFFLIIFGNLMILMIARSTNVLPVLLKIPQFLVNFCGSLLMLYLILQTIILWTGSISLTWIVEDQKNLWNIFPLFPLFVLYLIFILHFCHKKPFGSLKSRVFPVEDYRIQHSGGLDWLLQISEEVCYILLCGLGVILFMGGGTSPIKTLPLPSIVWFSIKSVVLIFMLSGISSRFPNLKQNQVLSLMLKGILPISIFLFFVYLGIKTLIL